MIMAYSIQHDWLFSEDELAYYETEEGVLNGKFDFRKAVPVRLSLLLGYDGERYFGYFSRSARWILLLDDVSSGDNPAISAYKGLLVRAIIMKFRNKGVSCMIR